MGGNGNAVFGKRGRLAVGIRKILGVLCRFQGQICTKLHKNITFFIVFTSVYEKNFNIPKKTVAFFEKGC